MALCNSLHCQIAVATYHTQCFTATERDNQVKNLQPNILTAKIMLNILSILLFCSEDASFQKSFTVALHIVLQTTVQKRTKEL